jgi:hypothetical protein
MIIPKRVSNIDVYSKLVKEIAPFALKRVREKSGETCSWGSGCTELAAVISCESQKVEVQHIQQLSR